MITSPLDYSGCVVWLDATDTTTLSSLSGGAGNSLINTSLTGDSVGGWGDKSGNGRNFTNIGGSAASRPTWISSLSSLRFDSGDYLSFLGTITYTSQTVFVVASFTNPFQVTLYSQNAAGASAISGYLPMYLQTPQMMSWGTNSTFAAVNYRSLNVFDIFTSRHTGSLITNFVNGSTITSTGNTAHSLGTLVTVRSAIGDGAFTGSVSEVIVYNKALSNAEREDVEYYLTRKWSFLNVIPRQVYPVQNGNWSNSTTWSTSADPAPWTFPLSSDNVFSNTFTVTANQNVRVSTLQTAALFPNIAAGGTFTITQPNITIVPINGVLAGTTACITGLLSSGTSILSGNIVGPGVSHAGNGELRIIGNVTGGSVALAAGATNNGNGLLSIYGNVLGGPNGATSYGAFHNGAGTLTIVGNISGAGPGTTASTGVFNNSTGNVYVSAVNAIRGGTGSINPTRGIHNSGTGNVYITGDCLGGTGTNAHAVLNGSLGAVIINGNVSANFTSSTGGAGVVQSSDGSTTANATNGTLLINGNIFAGPAQHGVVSGSTAARNEFTGALINSDNGRQAVYVARYLLKPKVFDSYTYHKNTEIVNLLFRSEELNNSSSWVVAGTTVTTNVTAAPFGGALSAERLQEDTSTGQHTLRASTVSTVISSVPGVANDLVFSVFARANNQRRHMALIVDSGAASNSTTPAGSLSAFGAMFDLIAGSCTALTATGTNSVVLTSITNEGNGWWRCMVEGRLNMPSTPWPTFPTIALSDRSNFTSGTFTSIIPTYTGVGTVSGIGLWGAQYQYNSLTRYFSSDGTFQGFGNLVPPVFFYSPEAYDMAYVPNTSSVRIGTLYGAVSTLSGIAVNIPEQLEGTMFVPSSSVVALGTLVDNTTGTAILNAQSLQNAWNTNVNSINLANSIGVRLKNAALLPDIGEQIGSVNI